MREPTENERELIATTAIDLLVTERWITTERPERLIHLVEDFVWRGYCLVEQGNARSPQVDLIVGEALEHTPELEIDATREVAGLVRRAVERGIELHPA